MKNICFKLFAIYLLFLIIFFCNNIFAEGKNDMIYDVYNENVVVRRNNTIAVFGDSRLSNALYSIPQYRGVTFYTFEGFSFDDMIYFFTGMYKDNPALFQYKIHPNKLLFNVNYEDLDRLYDTFLKECKDYEKIIVQVAINSLQFDSTRFQANYMQFLNLLHEKCNNAKICLVKCFGFGTNIYNYPILNQWVKNMNDNIDKLTNYFDYIDVINGKMTFVTDFNTYQLKDGYATDGIHVDHHLDEYYKYVESIFEEAKIPIT